MKRILFLALLICLNFKLPVMAQPQECIDIENFTPTLSFDKNYYQEQVESYNVQIKIKSNDSELFALRGDAYYALQDYAGAISDFKQATVLNSNYIYAYARLGDTYQQIFDLQAALDNYDQAISLDKAYAYSYIKRGVLYRKLGEVKTGEETIAFFQMSLDDFTTGIELDPKSSLAYLRRSELYDDLGEWDLALADAQTAVELDPESVFASTNLGMRQYSLKKYSDALKSFEQSLHFRTDAASDYAYAFTARAVVCNRLNVTHQAELDIDQALSFDTNYAYAYFHKAIIEKDAGNNKDAIKYLLSFVTLYPLDPYAYELLKLYRVDTDLYADSYRIFTIWSKYQLDSLS